MVDASLLQFVVNGLVVGGILVLGAVGLTLVYGIRRFANFAHGDFLTLGAYVAWVVNVQMGLDVVVAAIVAMVSIALFGLALEHGLFWRFEGRGPLPPLIATVGLSFVLQNVVRMVWGTSPLTFRLPAETAMRLGPVAVTPTRLLALAVAVLVAIGLHVLLTRTRLGIAMRATADDVELARTTGIDTRVVVAAVWLLGGALAALAGVFLAATTQLSPTMGFGMLLLLFASVILGGIGSPYGAVLGGFLIGLSTEVSKPVFFALNLNATYSLAVAFVVMIVVLLLRPTGILGAGAPPLLARFRRRSPTEAAP
ncbi:MAG TPA: branched-chain amino acid ABC transporter permease [Candidatus Thermoplasmatota archaeon]|nr:branched-chain amino acid ABC transporter permease [Candidatus Thermoplasmatota archaeon]